MKCTYDPATDLVPELLKQRLRERCCERKTNGSRMELKIYVQRDALATAFYRNWILQEMLLIFLKLWCQSRNFYRIPFLHAMLPPGLNTIPNNCVRENSESSVGKVLASLLYF